MNASDTCRLTQSASASEIKKRYRELSLKYHPDRNPDAGEMFMRIAKAYETLVVVDVVDAFVQLLFYDPLSILKSFIVISLTDEVSRDNWVKYGNPDGPRSLSFSLYHLHQS